MAGVSQKGVEFVYGTVTFYAKGVFGYPFTRPQACGPVIAGFGGYAHVDTSLGYYENFLLPVQDVKLQEKPVKIG